MDKYSIITPEVMGTFNDRLNFLYLKLGNYLDIEKQEHRTLQYCKVFPDFGTASPKIRFQVL